MLAQQSTTTKSSWCIRAPLARAQSSMGDEKLFADAAAAPSTSCSHQTKTPPGSPTGPPISRVLQLYRIRKSGPAGEPQPR